MKKNKLFIILSIITIIVIFGVGSTFTLCGTPISIGETDETVTEAEQDKASSEIAEEPARIEEEPAIEREAPTISLSISEGPFHEPVEDLCYYRLQASVTGYPTPIIEFSRDDSLKAYGPTICQVNLSRDESYTLTATATNSEGSATDSMTLTWGCDGDEIALAEEIETAEATRPEDETLTEPDITIEDLTMAGMNGCVEGGRTDKPFNIGTFMIGDNAKNEETHCWASYVIRHLEGVTVTRATIHIREITEVNKASAFGPFIIEYRGETLASIPTDGGLTEIHVSNDRIRDAVQNSIDEGNMIDFYFQMKLANVSGKANTNGVPDQFHIDYMDPSNVRLVIEYY